MLKQFIGCTPNRYTTLLEPIRLRYNKAVPSRAKTCRKDRKTSEEHKTHNRGTKRYVKGNTA